ncbi:MAG: cytochrome c oxidase subunit 3 [Lewinellaceae bacterium]|nr:cytochrome c oxidase subunit 3 [Lewinella sp.]MCB9278286.1 cytochrome c oxidase subunit 3 [Lewinellaceae bacterium]
MNQGKPDPDHHEPSNLFHPLNVLLTLAMFSMTALFLSMTLAFIYTRVQSDLPPVNIPILFVFNTLILLGSSFAMYRAQLAYKADETRRYQHALIWTVGLSVLFLISQIFAWRELFLSNIKITSSPLAGYLYVISGLHFLHLLGGIPFLIYFLWQAYKYLKEPMTVLIYFSDSDKRLRLRLLTVYWHFLDGLWIYLVLFFWVNYLIR